MSETPNEGRPRLLDLFAGAGGAAMGYSRAGFEVVGVDIVEQPNYPFEFVQEDALRVAHWLSEQREGNPEVPESLWWAYGADAVHASPPCQAYSTARMDADVQHPELLEPTRELLKATGLPYVIENVPGAPMPDAILLCGTTFGLPLVRHRLFEIHPPIGLVPSMCHQKSWARGVEHPGTYSYAHGNWRPAWREHVMPVVWPWMTLEESGQAIPPAYTEWIGMHLIAEVNRRARGLVA